MVRYDFLKNKIIYYCLTFLIVLIDPSIKITETAS